MLAQDLGVGLRAAHSNRTHIVFELSFWCLTPTTNESSSQTTLLLTPTCAQFPHLLPMHQVAPEPEVPSRIRNRAHPHSP